MARRIPWRLVAVVIVVVAIIVVGVADRQVPRKATDSAARISLPATTKAAAVEQRTDTDGAHRLGVTWVKTYLRASTEDPGSWRRSVARISTPQLRRLVVKTDTSRVPVSRVEHSAVRMASTQQGQVTVRLRNGWALIVTATEHEGRWVASAVQVNTL